MSARPPGKDGKGIASGTLRYLHDRRSQQTYVPPGSQTAALEGVSNPDFLALGLGGTNLMAMLWAVAMGKRAVGVELRGDPSLGVHWNIRVDLFHQLGLIDQMMLNRYAEADIPHRDNGQLFSLADCFYSSITKSGDVVPDEIIDGYDDEQHIVGTIQYIEYIDDRYSNGVPSRTITQLPPPAPPILADPMKIRGDMKDVLDGPSTFQAAAAAIQVLLRRYLEKIEEMDLARERYPRVRLFTQHRVVEKERFGFIRQEDGRLQVRIEEVVEMDMKGTTIRIRSPGSDIIDLGVPELFSIAQGARSSDARRLGFEQHDVVVDHGDGRGPVVAQADYIAGLFDLLVDGRLRRRIASHFDEDGNEYWIRQIAVGHENDPEVAWILVQVPDNMTFDPIKAGLVAPNTCESSVEYFMAYQILLQDFYLEQAALVLGMKVHELRKVEQVYGPKIFSLVECMGDDARIAPNGVIAGDSFGNGHFMTSAGAMTGMIGHSFRFLEHWQRRSEGIDMNLSINLLADRIKSDTEDWLSVSAKEFTEAIPINFGTERIAQIAAASGIDPKIRAQNVAVARKHRHGLIPLDSSDWRRLFLKNGRVLSSPLPRLSPDHPELAEWIKENPNASMKKPKNDSNPGEVMMGAAPMRPSTPTVLKSDIESLENELAQLKFQYHEQTRMATTGVLLKSDMPDRIGFEAAIPRRPSYSCFHCQSSPAVVPHPHAPHEFSPARALTPSSPPVINGAKKRERKVERFNRKMELVRQREEAHREIQALSQDSPITPKPEEECSFPPPAPSLIVSKVLGNIEAQVGAKSPRSSSTDTSYAEPPTTARRPFIRTVSTTSSQTGSSLLGSSASYFSQSTDSDSKSSSSVRSSLSRKEYKGMLML